MAHYIVTEETGVDPIQTIVESKTPASAMRAVVEPRFTVRLATPQELITLVQKGAKVVVANGTAKSEAVGK